MEAITKNPPSSKIPFYPTLVIVSILTFASLICAIYLMLNGEPTPDKSALIETLSTTWKMGFGALLGLLGGKALSNK